MAKQIARLLKTAIGESSDLKKIAKELAGKGRGGDSMLAHITPKEANILKAAGGAGTVNPDTGLLEFYDEDGLGASPYPYMGNWGSAESNISSASNAPAPVEQAPAYDWSAPINVSRPEGGFGTSPALASQPEQAPAYDWSSTNVANRNFGTAPYDAAAREASIPGYAPATTPNLAAISGQPVGQRPGIDLFAQQPQVAARDVTAPGVVTPPGQEKGLVEKLKDYLTTPTKPSAQEPSTPLERLGVAGLGALPGILQSRAASRQGQRAREQMQRLAAPYQQQGRQLIEQAQRGELTAPNQQQIQALQARAAQGAAARGGVGAEQSAAQIEAFRQQLLSNQYDLGLKVSGIGDQIALGAIKSGLEADKYVSELTSAYYNNMFRGFAGMGQPQQQPQPPR